MPPGAATSATSPADLPIKARAIGEPIEIFPPNQMGVEIKILLGQITFIRGKHEIIYFVGCVVGGGLPFI